MLNGRVVARAGAVCGPEGLQHHGLGLFVVHCHDGDELRINVHRQRRLNNAAVLLWRQHPAQFSLIY